MDKQLDELVTSLIEIGDDLEMYGRQHESSIAFNLGQAVRSLGMMARIEFRNNTRGEENS